MNVLELLLTFSAVLGPLFLLPLGRPLGRFGVGGPTGSCGIEIRYGNQWKQSSSPRRYETTIRIITSCCFRGRPLPLRGGSGADWAVLGWGDGSLVPLLLMPGSVHLRQRAWASNPRRSCLESFEDRRPECQRRDSVKEKKTLLLSVIILGYKTHFVWAQRPDWIQTGA